MAVFYSVTFFFSLKFWSLVTQKSLNCFHPLVLHIRFQHLSLNRYFTAMAKAVGNRLTWDLTANGIRKRADEIIAMHKKIWDEVGSVKHEDVSYENVLKPLLFSDREYAVERNNLDFVQHVYADKTIRDASVEADKKLSEFDVELSMRQDVYDVIVVFEKKSTDGLTAEEKRYLERKIKDGRRDGLHLPKTIQQKIQLLKRKISEISINFMKNLNDENTVLEFTMEELAGLPDDFIQALEKADAGKYKVTLTYPHYFPCMKKARNPETRKRLETAFNSRCIKENTKILEDLIKLRHEKANLLGFPNHAAFVLEMRMAKTPEAVHTFLEDLSIKLQPLKAMDLETFLQYKKEEREKHGYPFDNRINMWDLRYYMTMVEEKKYAVDHQRLKEYFPIEVVTKGLLDIYQELLSLEFKHVVGAEVWHEDVTMYSVTDKATSALLGYFYLDLFPREGKYGHAACFLLQLGCVGGDGSRQEAVTAMVTNFTKPTADRPSLLQHEEVETYFHEFGHLMHMICAQSQLAFFSGTHVERDFLEAPSQMLENWCWEKVPLSRMSAHYKDQSPIPDDILDKLIQSRKANAGVFNMRQILLSTFDQTIHTQPEADTTQVFSELSEKLLGIPSTEGTNMPASFDHLATGYDAQFYSYLWSQVFSMDMFASRFKKEGVMCSKTGTDYRHCILQPGGSLDAADMLRNFLGRDPEQDAFLISKGLQPESQEENTDEDICQTSLNKA